MHGKSYMYRKAIHPKRSDYSTSPTSSRRLALARRPKERLRLARRGSLLRERRLELLLRLLALLGLLRFGQALVDVTVHGRFAALPRPVTDRCESGGHVSQSA